MSRGAHAATKERRPTFEPTGRAGAGVNLMPSPRRPDPAERIAAPTTLDTREGRAALRRRTAQHHRRRVQAMLGIVVVTTLLAATGAWLGWMRPAPSHPAAPVTAPQTQTLLVEVRGADGNAAASTLFAARPSGDGAAILLPSAVIATVPGAGQQRLGAALGLTGGARLARDTVSDLLGVRVDQDWVLDATSFGSLVDAVDGIDVDVDIDVLSKNAAGATQVVVGRGPHQHLDGRSAAAVLLYRPAGEDQIQSQPRIQAVLGGLLAALSTGDQLATLLAEHPAPIGSTSSPDLAAVLGRLHSMTAASAVQYQTLPVQPLDTDGAPAYRLDFDAVDGVVRDQLAGAELPGRDRTGNRVLVANAVGTPGIGDAVRGRIVPAGFTFAGSKNLTPFGRAKTIVVVFDTDAATTDRARRLAAAIGLPDATISVSTRGQSIADLMIVVGKDFKTI
jgi:hypothetical protein